MEKQLKTAGQLASRSGAKPITAGPSDTVLSVIKTLADHDIGAVLVMEGPKLVGIVSERDCVRKLDLKGRSAKDTLVRDIMATDVVSVTPAQSVDECMVIMHKKRIRHLPVTDAGRVVGVLSSRDVLESVIESDEKLIKDLSHERVESLGDTGGTY